MGSLFTLLGGLGLFLIGMQVLTDGLKSLAGETLRKLLVRFTQSPVSGAATGAVATAILQSSSATTVAAVGFVGAGLLTFNQALGIIFGANIGTTITGWIVALIGFKLELTTLVFPLVFAGAMLKLFTRGWVQQLGWAVAGFSLIFIGIDALQSGMSVWESTVTPDTFPGDTLFGRLQLVGLGILITIVTQSSSAGVATALVALSVGAISFTQAAAMVIGMDVGTTFTAFLATLGRGTAMRRTGYAHVVYNVMTGILAFFLLTPFVMLASNWLALDTAGDAQIALVAFHSSFNILGVILIIGVTRQFAELIERLVPAREAEAFGELEDRLLQDGAAATNAVAGQAAHIADSLVGKLSTALAPGRARHTIALDAEAAALTALSQYAERIRTEPGSKANYRLQSVFHALDHLVRLQRRMESLGQVRPAFAAEDIRNAVKTLQTIVTAVDEEGFTSPLVDALDEARQDLRDRREAVRLATIERISGGLEDASDALGQLDAMRWLHRSTYHIWRIGVHLENALSDTPHPLLITDEHRVDTAQPA
ncbi:Na/Pi cotransporter family protein [Henriciella aquimarina]|uniref:Na/Pi cotransporter family protein n=1 Tax=Henriciella aquimarina TaxID=545261 RepID=UPI000A0684FC|nr:Na/Pi symporter [Henriciella aquimarina]